jgi:hypothetical protein
MCAALATERVRLEGEAAHVQAIYRGVVIASRCLRPGERFLVGATAEVDAPVAIGDLPGPSYALVSAGDGELVVAPTARMSLTRADAGVRVVCGEVLFLVAPTELPQDLPRPALVRPRDEGPAFAAAAGLIVLAALLAALPPARATISGDLDDPSVRGIDFRIIPPAPVLPRGTSPSWSGAGRAAAPRKAAARKGKQGRAASSSIGLLGVLTSFQNKSAIFSTGDGVDESEVLSGLQNGTGAGPMGGLDLVGTGAGGPLDVIGTGQMTTACQGDCRGLGNAQLTRRGPLRVPAFPTGEVKVRGTLDKEIVRRIVRHHLNEVRYCYERVLIAHPALAGRVVATFTILPTGRVAASAIAESTLKNAAVEGCIAQSVRRWEFPRTEGLVIVSYPFSLVMAGE